MPGQLVPWFAVVAVSVTATGLLLSRDWRWLLGLLAVQYLGAAALAAQHWPLGMAAAKLVAGWMATAALGMTLTVLPYPEEVGELLWPQGRPYRLFMAGTIFVLAAAVTPRIEGAMSGVGSPVIAGTIVLTGLGLIHLGISSEVPRNVVGLLTVLSGFEIFYAAIEGSILVAGLLAVVNLGIGLGGAYLISASATEKPG
jgi:hypothetical protein